MISHDPGKVYDRSNQKFLSKTMAAKVIFKAKIITRLNALETKCKTNGCPEMP